MKTIKRVFRCSLTTIIAVMLLPYLSGKIFAAEQSLGKVDFETSCREPAHAKFNQGLALLHHMMYSQAQIQFSDAVKRDRNCAMAHWGIAMTYFHPLWAPPEKPDLIKGQAAIKRARALNPPTQRERDYIAAVEIFYDDWMTKSHNERITMWEAAQKKVFEANSNDVDAAALFALSHLATAPKDDKTYSHQKRAGALLEEFHTRWPDHPALYHYTIHAYDNPELAHRGEAIARGYDKIAPDVPHALHMPSHIFVRLGYWPETIAWNIRSAKAAKEQSTGGVISLHNIHAMDYLMYAYLQQGDDEKAKNVLNEINTTKDYQDSFASAYAIAAAPARYFLERNQWKNAANLPIRSHPEFPWEKYPWHEAITYFGRGLGAARSGDTTAARQALKKLDELYQKTVDAEQNYWAVLVDAQRKTVAAWIADAEGKKTEALALMRKAADIEDSVDKHPVTPGAVRPARELLGDMLVQQKKMADAVAAYQASLDISPNRYNSVFGIGYASELKGDNQKARASYKELIQMAGEKSRPKRRQLEHANAYLGK